jgi:HSP20 family protein
MAESPEKSAQMPAASSNNGGLPAPVSSLRREIERVFEDFERGFWPGRLSLFEGFAPASAAVPAVDIVEKDNAFEISAELPGMDEKDVHVECANGMISIRGEKTESKEEKKKDFHLSERRYGAFQRRFRMPEGVDDSKIDASFKKGVLTITMPKNKNANAKQIEIKSN